MKKIALILLLSTSLFLTACGQQKPKTDNAVVLTQLSGKQIHLNKLQGKWIVLNYWASWCKPCYKEVPELNAFQKQFKNKILVLGVSYDRVEPDQLPAIIKKMRIKFPTLKYDPIVDIGIEQVPGLPATYIINPQGHVVKQLLGLQTEKSLIKAIGKKNIL